MARVLPVPAPASTHSGPVRVWATARWSSSRAASSSSLLGVGLFITASVPAATHTAASDGPKYRACGARCPWYSPNLRWETHEHDDARGRHHHDVHHQLVRLLPPAEASAGPRVNHLPRGEHRGGPRGCELRRAGQRRQPDRAHRAVPRRHRRDQPFAGRGQGAAGLTGNGPPYQSSMSARAIEERIGRCTSPAVTAAPSSARVKKRASVSSSPSTTTSVLAPAATRARKAVMSEQGKGQGWLP